MLCLCRRQQSYYRRRSSSAFGRLVWSVATVAAVVVTAVTLSCAAIAAGDSEAEGGGGAHVMHAVRLQLDAVRGGSSAAARNDLKATPAGAQQQAQGAIAATPKCSLERYWARLEEYYDGSRAQREAVARDDEARAHAPLRVFAQHHLCAAQQRRLGWEALHGGRRGEPERGPLGLSVLGVEGTGHHMTTFSSGVLWQAPAQVFAKLNLTLLETLSFPYSSRMVGKAGIRGGHYRSDGEFGQRYMSRTDRTVVQMYPYERVWRSPAKAYNFEDRFRDQRVLFAVLARDPARSVVSNLARFYGTVGLNGTGGYSVEPEVAPFSDAALELELRQQAVAYTNVELLARSVPCGRLFLMPFEVFLADPCSTVDALWHFVGRGRHFRNNGTALLMAWQRQVASFFAAEATSPSKLALLDWEACKRHEEALGAEGYTPAPSERERDRLLPAPTPRMLAAVRRCETVLGDRASHYFARLRFMWPLQAPFWSHALDPLRGTDGAEYDGKLRHDNSGEDATPPPLEAWQDPATALASVP